MSYPVAVQDFTSRNATENIQIYHQISWHTIQCTFGWSSLVVRTIVMDDEEQDRNNNGEGSTLLRFGNDTMQFLSCQVELMKKRSTDLFGERLNVKPANFVVLPGPASDLRRCTTLLVELAHFDSPLRYPDSSCSSPPCSAVRTPITSCWYVQACFGGLCDRLDVL